MPIAVRNPLKYVEGIMEFNVLKIPEMRWIKVYVLPPWKDKILTSRKFKLSPEWYIKEHYLFKVWMEREYCLMNFEGLGALGQAIMQKVEALA
jgi:hypothetical protein